MSYHIGQFLKQMHDGRLLLVLYHCSLSPAHALKELVRVLDKNCGLAVCVGIPCVGARWPASLVDPHQELIYRNGRIEQWCV